MPDQVQSIIRLADMIRALRRYLMVAVRARTAAFTSLVIVDGPASHAASSGRARTSRCGSR